MRGALLAVAAVACRGGAAPSATIGNRGAAEVAERGWTCPPGDEVRLRLDDDDLPDRVRLSPSAAATTCLEIHATRTPPLVCSEARATPLPVVEPSDAAIRVSGEHRCDPMGARVEAFHDGGTVTGTAVLYATPEQVHHFALLLGETAPTHSGLRLAGGDAAAVVAWRRGRWTWIEL